MMERPECWISWQQLIKEHPEWEDDDPGECHADPEGECSGCCRLIKF